MKEENKVFKILAFVLLILLCIEIPLVVAARKMAYDHYLVEVEQAYASGDEELAKSLTPSVTIADGIYSYNKFLCVCSVILISIYGIKKLVDLNKDGKFNLKQSLKKNWPVILLACFMIWASVGCIQAGMEASAEAYIKNHPSGDSKYEYYSGIAGWTEGDRMPNAADRSWNGCTNLKDGYFSFMFYAAVLLNVLLLGIDSDNYKRYVIRVLILSSFIVGFLTLLAFFRPTEFSGILYADRSVFNNRNHFGYYISVILIASICSFIREKNIYFSAMSLLNAVLYSFHLFTCDTFGAYLGILFALVFLGIVAIYRAISDKKIAELVRYAIAIIPFIFLSCTYVSMSSKAYSTTRTTFDYSIINLNVGGKISGDDEAKTTQFTFCSLTDEKAKEFNIKNTNSAGTTFYWGNQSNVLKSKQRTFVEANFATSTADFKKLVEHFKNKDESGDSTQGEYADLTPNEVLTIISAKYPKVSGETLEEWQARQDNIEAEFQQYVKDYNIDLTATNGGTTAATTTPDDADSLEDVSNIGSGRGPVWIRCLDLMNQRPMFGWGLENLLNEFYQQYKVSEGRTHNLVLQLGGTTGLPGVIMYLVATIAIWLKVLFDAKTRKYSKTHLIVIGVVYALAIIFINVVVSSITDKLFFNALITTIAISAMACLIHLNGVHLRIKEWTDVEHIGMAVFVSYMIGSLFGNSAFYTSPYFMIFMGILTAAMLHKKNYFVLKEEATRASTNESKNKKATKKA